jgi:tetratricopeptide (TPR) repeat protein
MRLNQSVTSFVLSSFMFLLYLIWATQFPSIMWTIPVVGLGLAALNMFTSRILRGRRASLMAFDEPNKQQRQPTPAEIALIKSRMKSPFFLFWMVFPIAISGLVLGYKSQDYEYVRNPDRDSASSKFDAKMWIWSRDLAVKQDPQNPYAYKQRGTNYFDAAKYPEAIADLTKTLDMVPNNTEARDCRARCYMILQQYKPALADWNALLTTDDYQARVHRSIGVCQYHLGDYQAALEAFSGALKGQPDYDEVLHDRALTYRKLGNEKLAQADLAAMKYKVGEEAKYWLQ